MENQTVPTQIPTSVPEIPLKSSKFPLIPFLLFILVMLLIVSTGYLYYQNMQLKGLLASYQTQTVATPAPSVSPEPVAEAEGQIANWKTYTNTNTGYSLKYPKTWSVVENPKPLGVGEITDTKLNLSNTNDIPNVQILVFSSTSDYVKSITPGGGVITTIDGVSATKYTSEAQTFGISYQVAHGTDRYFINLELSSSQDESLYEPLFNQILSTFKFTN